MPALPFEPEVVLASFHGLPRDYLDKGDPYHCQCQKTTRLLRERLGWPEEKLRIVFQSRFGARRMAAALYRCHHRRTGEERHQRLAVVMPGFAADCLETLEEIGIRGAETFRENGGEEYAALPCLNDSAPGMRVLETVVRRELAGWLADR